MVQFTSQLNTFKGLTNLLTSAPAWAKDSVTLYKNGVAVASSPSEVWWTDSVVAAASSLFNSPGPGLVSNSGTINVVTANTNFYGLNFTASNIGFVVLPPAVMSSLSSLNNCDLGNGLSDGGNNTISLICAGSQNYLWVEGAFSGQTSAASVVYGLYLSGVNYSVFNQLALADAEGPANGMGGMITNISQFNRFSNLVVENANYGFYVSNANYNLIVNANSSNETQNSFELDTNATGNVLSNVVMANLGQGQSQFQLNTSSNSNFFSRLTVTNNVGVGSTNGVTVSQSNSNIFNNMISANNFGNHYSVAGAGRDPLNIVSASINNTFNQIALASFGDEHICFDTDTTGNLSVGNLWFDTAVATTCETPSGTNNSNSLSATVFGPGGSCAVLTAQPLSVNAVVTAFPSTFVSEPTSESSANYTGLTAAYSTGIDFYHFDNMYQGWGYAGVFPNSPASECQSGSGETACQIWDWSLSKNDTNWLNTSGTGISSNSAFVPGGTCPAEVNGNVAVTDETSTYTFLQNAAEIIGSGGNDNGLCETGETCLYTPNLGAYQGHGTLAQCNFVGGTVKNVTMWGYEQNGR